MHRENCIRDFIALAFARMRSFIRLAFALLCCVSIAAFADDAAKPSPPLAVDASTPPPQASLAANMKPLFAGKAMDEWSQIPSDSWTIKNDILASLGSARGVIYTRQSFGRYRIIFDVRHNTGKPDHRAGVLVFCTAAVEGEKPLNALAEAAIALDEKNR